MLRLLLPMQNTITTKSTKILKIFTHLTFCFLFGSVLFRIYCANDIAIKNEEFRNLFSQKKELEKELTKLKFIDANLSSLTDIESRALKIGFIEYNDSLAMINTKEPIPVAANLPN